MSGADFAGSRFDPSLGKSDGASNAKEVRLHLLSFKTFEKSQRFQRIPFNPKKTFDVPR